MPMSLCQNHLKSWQLNAVFQFFQQLRACKDAYYLTVMCKKPVSNARLKYIPIPYFSVHSMNFLNTGTKCNLQNYDKFLSSLQLGKKVFQLSCRVKSWDKLTMQTTYLLYSLE